MHTITNKSELWKGCKNTYIILPESTDGNASSDAECTKWDIFYVTETKPQYYYWQRTTTETQYYYGGNAGKGRKLGKSDKQIVMKEVEVLRKVKICVSYPSR